MKTLDDLNPAGGEPPRGARDSSVRIKEALAAVRDAYLEQGNIDKPLVITFSSRVALDAFLLALDQDLGRFNELQFDNDGESPAYDGIQFTLKE